MPFPTFPFITYLTYSSLLLVVCVYCAFKTRQLPDNYNIYKSRFTSFSMYNTVIIWQAVITACFAVDKSFLNVMFMSLVV